MIASNFLFMYCTEQLMNKQSQCHYSNNEKKDDSKSSNSISLHIRQKKIKILSSYIHFRNGHLLLQFA